MSFLPEKPACMARCASAVVGFVRAVAEASGSLSPKRTRLQTSLKLEVVIIEYVYSRILMHSLECHVIFVGI